MRKNFKVLSKFYISPQISGHLQFCFRFAFPQPPASLLKVHVLALEEVLLGPLLCKGGTIMTQYKEPVDVLMTSMAIYSKLTQTGLSAVLQV